LESTVLAVCDLVKRFGHATAVDHISFEVRQGEVLTLLGPSGCGKTTTLRLVAGFERPDRGEIEIQGRVVVATDRRVYVPPEQRGLGMVFQSYAIWPHMTVFENVAYPLTARRVGRAEVQRRVEETLELVGLGGLGRRSALLLSGGQQQRVALARALVYRPSILLLDEPLSNLDAKLRGQMRLELQRLQEQTAVTVLYVTHDQLEAMALSSRLAVMNGGRIEQIDAPQEVYEQPRTPFVEDFLGRVLRFPGTLVAREPRGLLVRLDGAPDPLIAAPSSVEGVSPGARVLVAIRPEHVRLGAAEPAGTGDNLVRCQVEKLVPLGGECELRLRLGETLAALTVARPLAAGVAQTVDLHLPRERLRVWPSEAAAAAPPTAGLPAADSPYSPSGAAS
jgi:ABC-type Fe3+/spermidine/putrescine transport system ATPase subunit